ncbi:MAG: hypothetical protein JSV34_00285 [Candidatus Omnitrophota bacterium]|nr:MAG: hypothetical protein JSV34_00285 [Candidatus Omnitrophota bacterium]
MAKKGFAKVLSNITKVFTGRKQQKEQSLEGKYKCNICGRMVSEKKALVHVKAEEYIINLIKRDHPQWQAANYSCSECIDYYRKLIKEGEI